MSRATRKGTAPRRRDLILIGAAVVLAMGAAGVVGVLTHKAPARPACSICEQLAKAKALHQTGKMSDLDWARHRLDVLNHDWNEARLPLLRERERLMAGVKEDARRGELFETRNEILRARRSLKELDPETYRQERTELLKEWREWIDAEAASGAISVDEKARQLEAIRE